MTKGSVVCTWILVTKIMWGMGVEDRSMYEIGFERKTQTENSLGREG